MTKHKHLGTRNKRGKEREIGIDIRGPTEADGDPFSGERVVNVAPPCKAVSLAWVQ